MSVLDFSYEEWLEFFTSAGQPAYRAGQMAAWLWKRKVSDPALMTDFSKELREFLAANLDFTVPVIEAEEHSRDGTSKYLIRLGDGIKVESVIIRQKERYTACLSTQAGCPIGCPFCITGVTGFERNLTSGEIAGQLLILEKEIEREINNVVFMGMGEPFLNTEELFAAIRNIHNPKMRGLGIRHMTVSTAGITDGIKALAESGLGVRLAVSLHTSDNTLRDELVPCNTKHPLPELLSSLREYQKRTQDRITVEYALFDDVNDSLDDARKLVRLLYGIHAFVNLIPSNTNLGRYRSSKPEKVLKFQSVLTSAGFESEIRAEKGSDISAACGQLKAGKKVDETGKSPHRPDGRSGEPKKNRPDSQRRK